MSKYQYWNNGFSWIMTAIDMFSKFAWAIPIKNKTAPIVTEAMKQFLQDNTSPHILQSDNGSEFTSNSFKSLMKDNNIKQIFSLPYKPTSQGVIERFNGTLKRMIFKHMTLYKTKIWVDSLPQFVQNYNNSIHSTIKQTPNKAQYVTGKQEAKIKQEIISSSSKVLNAIKKYSPLNIGDNVRISNLTKRSVRRNQHRKEYFQNWSKGLYTVFKIIHHTIRENQYQLKNKSNLIKQKLYFRHELQPVDQSSLEVMNTNKKPTYNETFFDREKHLDELHQPTMNEVPLPTPPSSPVQTRSKTKDVIQEEEYEVEKIVDDGFDKETRKRIYFVKWKGYPDSQNTWEFINEIKHLQVYKDYLKNKKK